MGLLRRVIWVCGIIKILEDAIVQTSAQQGTARQLELPQLHQEEPPDHVLRVLGSQDSFNEHMFDKFNGIKGRGTSTLALKVDHEDSPPPRKAIHDSLSRFQNNPATAPL